MSDVSRRFGQCEICSAADWEEVRRGPVRDGAFGRLSDPDTVVARCKGCGAHRLEERRCQDETTYEGEAYRRLIGEPTDAAGYLGEHDIRMIQNLNALWPEPLRGKKIADVGCAAGSFLDHVRGLARDVVAIEPCQLYHGSLAQRGYDVFAYTSEALPKHEGSVDMAVSWEVLEHVRDPRAFLQEMGRLLAPNGRGMLSTPNRRDVLMELLPDDYPSFFYRVVHRWYFDEPSLRRCIEAAGMRVIKTQFVHRFGISNAMRWLRDRRPGGREPLPHLESPPINRSWASYLEDRGVADYLYAVFERAD